MKQSTKTYPSGNTIYILEPGDGYSYITTGTVWSKKAYVAKEEMISNWHDTNEDPPSPEDPVDPETQQLADVVNDAYEMANELI